MRFFFGIVLCLIWTSAAAQEWEDTQTFGPPSATSVLRILSSTDTDLFADILASFSEENPDISVRYFVASTADINKRFREAPDAFDVVISSAMDLQFKLANDGLARAHSDIDYPAWAQWRKSLFAFTSEPAAIVLNRAAFATGTIPQTRQELIRALRASPEVFAGRLGTYDVRQSGLGYLFATQDARTSETYWRLMEVMGSLETRLYCCSGEMIEDVASGRIALAYNVLGSYAQARQDLADEIQIIIPSDFQTTMMRTALVSAQAENPEAASVFLTHLLNILAPDGQVPLGGLPRLDLTQQSPARSTIALDPALLTYLDRLKNEGFLREWVNAVIQ